MKQGYPIFEDKINYLRSIETEMVEHFNELQNNWPDCYAEDHPMAQCIDALNQFIKKITPIDEPNTIAHCPFCFNRMRFTEASKLIDNEVKQHLTCDQCNLMVYIHQFI